MAKYKPIYMFSDDTEKLQEQMEAEGGKLKYLFGGKGANLNIMTGVGLPVPEGFTITTEQCLEFMEAGEQLTDELKQQILTHMRKLEDETGREFGNADNPLLVSVRSGARESMPGMMDTVLNLGLNDDVAEGLIELTGDERFVWDAYRRFIMMFGDVVMGIDRQKFEECLDEVKEKEGVTDDTDVSGQGMKEVVELEKELYRDELGERFPQEPEKQLMESVRAVFASWDNERAIAYRNIHGIPHHWGTAVNVQRMVFGNMGDNSGTGVAFTRDPATGENRVYGEYLEDAQGEDVVAGIRTPVHIDELEQIDPEVYEEFIDICDTLEEHYKDVQDLEFTVEEGDLFILQTRDGKRTAQAAIKIAVDMFDEGLVNEQEALNLIPPAQLDQLLHPQFDEEQRPEPVAHGVNASPGAAAGRVVFLADDAEEWAGRDEEVILVRRETSPEDVGGMAAAEGILTTFGGKTSHAAVVGRQMGKPCVVGCGAIDIDYDEKEFDVNGNIVEEGDYISIDGTSGEVMLGEAPLTDSAIVRGMHGDEQAQQEDLYQYFVRVMEWSDKYRSLGVRTNADTPEDSELALDLGAEGIGLTRTEHMFFGDDRILSFRKMILADSEAERREIAVDELLPHQREDFEGILKAMDGKPVIIRLLDPPLHEFLPADDDAIEEVAEATDTTPEDVRTTIQALHEANPMLGHRGCRLGITFPSVYEMQVRAIFEAACKLKKQGLNPIPEVMIPLVGLRGELDICFEYTNRIASDIIESEGVDLDYMIGTMIELPRACMVADEIAETAEFFSFGTNDLTQTTFGFSRDDVEGKFFDAYIEQGIFQSSPFQVVDEDGVGTLMEIAVERGRQTQPDVELGICGEHGGEPNSVEFCHEIGLDYVSCSPLRVPIARLAAAQAQINNPR